MAKGRHVKLRPGRLKELARFAHRKIMRRLIAAARKTKKFVTAALGGTTQEEAPKVDQRHQLDADGWINAGQWVHVKSSNVAGIRYDYDKSLLFVEFLNKGQGRSIYVYYAVETRKAKAFFNTGSMGSFLHWQIKKKGYSYAKLM